MSRFLRPAYALWDAYTPGEQPGDRQYLKLNTNESPFPPAAGVLQALSREAAEGLRLYGDPDCRALRQALAERYQLKPRQILCGNGSDELLSFAFMAWGQQGAAFADVSYGLYQVLSDLHGARALRVPLREDYSMDDRDYLRLHRLILIANPNAPTGMAMKPRQLAYIAEMNPDSVVAVDEAYVDFGAESCVPLVERHENLLVIQTFSKARALAGARIGYALGQEALIRDLEKVKNAINPYNVNALSQRMGIASLQDEAYFDSCRRAVMAAREACLAGLAALGFHTLPSLANFLFTRKAGMDGEMLYLSLKQRGILVRHFSGPRTKDFIRVSIGTKEQMRQFVAAAAEITGGRTP